MTTKQKPIDIEAVRELCAKATPGPWGTVGHGGVDNWPGGPEGEPDDLIEFYPNADDPGNAENNAALIAAARDIVPQLLDKVESQEAEIERLRGDNTAIDAIREWVCSLTTAIIPSAGRADTYTNGYHDARSRVRALLEETETKP